MKTYRVHDSFGNVVAEGTLPFCAKQIGAVESSLRYAAINGYRHKGYVIEDISPAQEDKEISHDLKLAGANWDAFCEPIRQRYGISVRK